MAESLTARFRELHVPGDPLLMPNAWDIGSPRLFESMGFDAVATTSSGFAATLGRKDGAVSLEEQLVHFEALVDAAAVPISADFENGYADEPDDVAANVARALDTGLSGVSVEDYTGDSSSPFYDLALATDRVAGTFSAALS